MGSERINSTLPGNGRANIQTRQLNSPKLHTKLTVGVLHSEHLQLSQHYALRHYLVRKSHLQIFNAHLINSRKTTFFK